MHRRLRLMLCGLTVLSAAVAVPATAATASGLTCTTAVQQGAPPPLGVNQPVPVGTAGSVVVQRTAVTSLAIVSATANLGWTSQIGIQSGTKVKAHFLGHGTPEVYRFVAYLNATGTKYTVKVSDCV